MSPVEEGSGGGGGGAKSYHNEKDFCRTTDVKTLALRSDLTKRFRILRFNSRGNWKPVYSLAPPPQNRVEAKDRKIKSPVFCWPSSYKH
jgi:hypothetical protein